MGGLQRLLSGRHQLGSAISFWTASFHMPCVGTSQWGPPSKHLQDASMQFSLRAELIQVTLNLRTGTSSLITLKRPQSSCKMSLMQPMPDAHDGLGALCTISPSLMWCNQELLC